MNKVYILFISCLLFSCTKEAETRSLKQDLSGSWEFERFIGFPFDNPSLPPGNGRIIVFGQDGSFERRQHDTVLHKGNFILEYKEDCYPGNSNIALTTSDYPHSFHYAAITDDGRLSLSTPNCYQDGGISYYRKLSGTGR